MAAAISALAIVAGVGGLKLDQHIAEARFTSSHRAALDVLRSNVLDPASFSSREDGFRVYAVNVVHKAPFKNPFLGYGMYLGGGRVITAAHVVGHWPELTNVRVFIAGKDLPATVLKLGSADATDLALLSVDEAKLPVALGLRRLPLCRGAILPGTPVVVVVPKKITYSRILPYQSIARRWWRRYGTLIEHPASSGSGVMSLNRGCLLGIISRKISKFSFRRVGRYLSRWPDGFAGYFVPASDIARFGAGILDKPKGR